MQPASRSSFLLSCPQGSSDASSSSGLPIPDDLDFPSSALPIPQGFNFRSPAKEADSFLMLRPPIPRLQLSPPLQPHRVLPASDATDSLVSFDGILTGASSDSGEFVIKRRRIMPPTEDVGDTRSLPLSKTPLPSPPIRSGQHPGESILLINHPLLQKIFTKAPSLSRLGEGTCWLVFKAIGHPLVVKVPSPILDPIGQRRRVTDSLTALQQFPKDSSAPLCPFPLPLEEIIALAQATSVLVQYQADPIQGFSSSHPLFTQVRDILTGMSLGTHPFIEDFRPENVGTHQGKLVHFDPSYLKQGKIAASSLICYFLEWAGGKKPNFTWTGISKELLGALIKPLQETPEPTDLSKAVLAGLLPYFI